MSAEPGPWVTAVIVTFNSREHIGPALDSLAECYSRGELKCVVVDNSSTDGTAEFVAASYRWVELIRSPANLGFGRGCNLGFERVSTPYVLMHNPDAVIAREAIENLRRFVQDRPQVGIVAPALVYEGGAVQPVGLMTTPEVLFKGFLGRPETMPAETRVEPGTPAFRTNWVCGAMMLIRSDLYRRLGGFDPRFFLYFEETDLLRRASQSGAEIWCVGEAVAQHVGAASAKTTGETLARYCIPEHYYRSRFYYLVKHFGWSRAVGAELLDWVGTVLRSARDRLLGRIAAGERRTRRPLLRFPARPDRLR